MTPDFLTRRASGHSAPPEPSDEVLLRDPQYFLDRREPGQHLLRPVLAQGVHALGGGDAADGGRIRGFHGQVANLVVDDQQLVDTEPAAIAGVLTLRAGRADAVDG